MALIICKECGKEISDQAKCCPNCGLPLKKKGRGFAITSLVLGIIACVYSVPTAVMLPEFYKIDKNVIGTAIYIMIFGILSLIFGIASHLKGCKLKKKTAGIILSTVSILILIISMIITVL